MLSWFIVILLTLLILLVWDLSAKCLMLQHRAGVSAIRLGEMEERRVASDKQHRRNDEEMQASISRLAWTMSALQRRVDAVHTRLDLIDQTTSDNPEVRAAVNAFISSFEHSLLPPPATVPATSKGRLFFPSENDPAAAQGTRIGLVTSDSRTARFLSSRTRAIR
jgi:hypothetical protein